MRIWTVWGVNLNNRVFLAACAMFSLSACASTYIGTPYTAPAEPLTQVAIVQDSLPENVMAYQAASVASNFGLLGALVDAGVQASRKDAVNDALETIDYTPEVPFNAYLVEALEEKGITASVLEGEDREDREFLIEYPVSSGQAEAYFDIVVMQYGYVQAGGNSWRPSVFADVRLVDVESGDTLMENRIAYNVVNPPAGVITLSANREFQFANREDMVTNPQRLADGIDDALRTVADTAIGLIR